jgi:hypothetical protein
MITMAKIRNIRNTLATVLILGSMSFSISNAQSLELVGSCDLIGDPEFIAVGGDFAYIGGYNPLLQIVNILDPENPFVVGSIDPGYRTWDLCISDVSDPSSPSLISTFEPYFVAHDVTVINNIAYLLDCYRLYVIDISNLAEPELLSDIILYINHADRMAIRDNYAYIESYAGSSPSTSLISQNTTALKLSISPIPPIPTWPANTMPQIIQGKSMLTATSLFWLNYTISQMAESGF